MGKLIWLMIIIAGFIIPMGNSFAEIKTIEESCEYVMGDNDAKIDAKRLCFLEAKRKVLERVGTYVESSTDVINFNLTRDEIKSYTAGLIKTEIVSEQTSFNGQSTVIRMKIKANVDTSFLASKMLEIHKDKDLANKYSKMADDYKNLEKQIRELQDKLSKTSDWASIEKARLEREETFNKLSALEKVKADIKQKTTVAVQNIEIGMTQDEVLKLVGTPRSRSGADLNYGNVWVIFENEIVTILVDARCYEYKYTVSGIKGFYFSNRNPCGAGKGIIKY
ncbi:MAG: hypothetical protein HY957_04940 [Nitrospirae bacterium]|nr:hypothetical protein [Nitrospirota bacterium]